MPDDNMQNDNINQSNTPEDFDGLSNENPLDIEPEKDIPVSENIDMSNMEKASETDYHFEIVDDVIVKAVSNIQRSNTVSKREVVSKCINCPYGFYEEPNENSLLHEFLIKYRPEYSE